MCFLEPVSQSGVKNTWQACEPLCGCDPAPCPRCVPGGTLVTGSGSSRSQVEPILPCWGSPGSASPSSRAQDSGEDLYVGAFPERGAVQVQEQSCWLPLPVHHKRAAAMQTAELTGGDPSHPITPAVVAVYLGEHTCSRQLGVLCSTFR